MKFRAMFNKMKDISEKICDKKISIFVISLAALILLFGIFWNIHSYIRIKTMSNITDLAGDLAGEENSGVADALAEVDSFRYVSGAACPAVSGATLRVVQYRDTSETGDPDVNGSQDNFATNCASGLKCVCYYSSQ